MVGFILATVGRPPESSRKESEKCLDEMALEETGTKVEVNGSASTMEGDGLALDKEAVTREMSRFGVHQIRMGGRANRND